MPRKTAQQPHGPATVTVKGRDMRLRNIGLPLVAALAVWFIAADTGFVTIRL
ncbi:hypothetical protein [Streptomyces roseolus]|uniref:hypothetical protein n=1 Tax=Streptomyces roseolus TaxID=67358 RepID=UPI003660F419